nr:hypothetical protein [Tanacetum cinerariifolium]
MKLMLGLRRRIGSADSSGNRVESTRSRPLPPHQQIRRIRYFGQHSEEARFPSNTAYPEKLIRRIQWRLMNISEYNNRGAHSKLSQYAVSDPSNMAYRFVFKT